MVRRLLKICLFLLIGLLLLVSGGLIYLKTALPNVGPPLDMTIEGSEEQIERGKYMANHVMACMGCHSKRNWTRYAGPTISGTLGMGGEVFDQEMGFPGKYISGNLTPANLVSWTDGEIFRAITAGVGKDGRALFPVMPHKQYGLLDPEDIKSVIAYLRTLEPIKNQTTPSNSDFPMNFIINTIPQKAKLSPMPAKSNTVEYGGYLVTAAACYDCHTKQEKGKFTGSPFAGGMKFPLPNNTVVESTNITSHANGIGNWTKEQFVNRFRMYSNSSYVSPMIKSGDKQTIMPWLMYSKISEEDLQAIFAFLNTVTPAE